MGRKRTLLLWAVPLGIAALLALYGVVLRRSLHGGLRASEGDMDVVAGRHRYRSYVLGLKVRDRVSETSLSKLYREVFGDPPTPVWMRASGAKQLLTGGWEEADGYVSIEASGELLALQLDALFTPEAKKEVLTKFFTLLRQDPSLAWEFADQLTEFLEDWYPSKKGKVGVRDLPAFNPRPGIP